MTNWKRTNNNLQNTTQINCIVFNLTWPGFKPTIYHTLGEHATITSPMHLVYLWILSVTWWRLFQKHVVPNKVDILWTYYNPRSAKFRGFSASLKPRNIMYNGIHICHIIILCQLWNHEYKEPTILGSLLEPRNLASTNISTFTECVFTINLNRNIFSSYQLFFLLCYW
jgi:hypothetical protein